MQRDEGLMVRGTVGCKIGGWMYNSPVSILSFFLRFAEHSRPVTRYFASLRFICLVCIYRFVYFVPNYDNT